MDYESTLQYLYGLTDYEKERIARYDPETLDLSRVKRVLARLDNPQQRFPSIHIAGTKGKGSVAATCASVLDAAGLRVGLYTSPHLHTFRERIRVNSELIPKDALTALVAECRPVFDTVPELTTFEAITAVAFTFFARCGVDFAVIEVGLGGRLDATNVITPLVAVITSLSFDHTYLLGDTLADIAREKAGIIKPGVPTVCAPQDPQALTVIQEICEERGSPLTLIGRDWIWQLPKAPQATSRTNDVPPNRDSQTFVLYCSRGDSPLEGTYVTPLLGRHQINNAAAAIATLDLLRGEQVGLRPREVRQGMISVRWPGRFEILQKDPPLVLDCAHNRDSVSKLVRTLEEWFPGRQWTFIVGASKDKDVTGMLEALAPWAERVLATQSRHDRAMPAEQVAELAAQILPEAGAPSAEIRVTDDLVSALRLAHFIEDPISAPSLKEEQWLGGSVRPTCVTGSIFVVADVREIWALHTGGELPETDHPITREFPMLRQASELRMQAT